MSLLLVHLGLHKLVNKERAKRKYQLCWKSKDLKTVYYVEVFTHMKKVSVKDRARKIRKEELYSNDK